MTRRLALTAAVTMALCGQNRARPQFDVVSNRVDHEGTGGAGDRYPQHGTWKWTRSPLSFLIMYAYDVSSKQITGIPNSFQGADPAFDITAKVPVGVTHEQFQLMLQAMLEDRFQLKVHQEMRELRVTTIEVAKGGAKLRPATAPCYTTQQPAAPGPDQRRCGEITQVPRVDPETITWEYIGWSASVADLGAALSPSDPVVDDTGIRGLYDFDVTVKSWLPPTDDPNEIVDRQVEFHRQLKAAFEKELGLTIDLEKTAKRPLPVIVVDHVEMPTPN